MIQSVVWLQYSRVNLFSQFLHFSTYQARYRIQLFPEVPYSLSFLHVSNYFDHEFSILWFFAEQIFEHNHFLAYGTLPPSNFEMQ